MDIGRAALIAFAGNFFIVRVLAAAAVLVPNSAAGALSLPHLVFFALTIPTVALLAWWCMREDGGNLHTGVLFGITGFFIALVTEFVTGISSMLMQTGSLSMVVNVIPSFGPFIAQWATVVTFAYWVIPAAAVGWWFGRKA